MTSWKAGSPPALVRFLVLWECQVVKRNEQANEQGCMAAAVEKEKMTTRFRSPETTLYCTLHRLDHPNYTLKVYLKSCAATKG